MLLILLQVRNPSDRASPYKEFFMETCKSVGLLPGAVSSGELWARMNAYQDDGLCARFAEKHDMTLERAQVIFQETKRFLFIAIVSQVPCSPSRIVDEMWHEFIVHTAKYRFFCEDFNGEFIDHTPSDVPEVDGYVQTKALATSFFGDELDDTAWPDPSAQIAGKCTCSNKGCTCVQRGEAGTLKVSRRSVATME